jgi:membrane-associated phospholipid phosphatase
MFEAIATSLVVTDLLRYFAGRNTPDWYDRLRSGINSEIKAGRLGFPSIHTSITFATLTYLSMYMCGKLGLFKADGGQMWKAVVSIAPVAGAAVLSLTRTMDYHSDFTDILAGAFIGILVGIFSYYLNFPSLSSANSDLPKSRNENQSKRGRLLYDDDEDNELNSSSSVNYSFSTGDGDDSR